jgi:hypothetical protein
VTPDSKIYREKVKMCRFSSGYSAPNSCNFPWLVKRAHICAPSKKKCNKLNLTAAQYCDWSIRMIGPGGLLLVVPMNMQFQLQFYSSGCPKKTFNFIIQSDKLSTTGGDGLNSV